MKTIKPLIVCESTHHGNTLKVAKVIATSIDGQVLPADRVTPEDLEECELVGFGSGIYFGSHAPKLLRLAESLPPGSRKVFLFSTAGLPMFWRRFHNRLRRTIDSHGGEIVGEFNCPGWDSFGFLSLIGGIYRKHPNEKDLQRAKEFAESLMAQKPTQNLASASKRKPRI